MFYVQSGKEHVMNITLSAPEETVRLVRSWAEGNHTSLNRFIREKLEEKARDIQAERDRKAEAFEAFFRTLPPVKMPPGWKFDREEANYRDMKCLHDPDPERGRP